MKKVLLLSAVMSLGLSSFAFAADNPPPPPEKASAQQSNHGHDSKAPQHNGQQPPKG
ncbi:hypothetical protein QTP37_06085 [Klebsiella spallanzanii]|nr:hypothetical protein [Klebsiella spallanzanii]MDM4206580.1 hypothetical protein [Klebsiella spallanzanii]